MFIPTACGEDSIPVPISLPEDVAAHSVLPDPVIDISGDTADPVSLPPPISILWGVNPNNLDSQSFGYSPRIKPESTYAYINEKFYVRIEPEIFASRTYEKGRKIPDIDIANPVINYEIGYTRTIPREMIELYAPDYANLLTLYNGWEYNHIGGGEYTGLSTFSVYNADLPAFSVYRLDWLEELFIAPKGDVLQLDTHVYFTPSAFTRDEFRYIMNAFSGRPIEKRSGAQTYSSQTYGFGFNHWWGSDAGGWDTSLGAPTAFRQIAPVLGMFGVNAEVVNDKGRVLPFYASEKYKEALLFLQELLDAENVYIHTSDTGRDYSGHIFVTDDVIGWISVPANEIYGFCQNIKEGAKNTKLLITPPEIGPDGDQGVGAAYPSSLFTPEKSWVIRKDVEDGKLARILQMFNAMAFDPESYMRVVYGLEDFHYEWTGTPFESEISPVVKMGNNAATGRPERVNVPSYAGVQFFNTNVYDGKTSKDYHIKYNTLQSYARTEAAQKMNGHSYREEIWGKNEKAKTELDIHYYKGLMEHAAWFISYFLHRQETVDAYWDQYIHDLNGLGLGYYIDFYNQQ